MEVHLVVTIVIFCATRGLALPATDSAPPVTKPNRIDLGPLGIVQNLDPSIKPEQLAACLQPLHNFFNTPTLRGAPSTNTISREKFLELCGIGKSFFLCLNTWVNNLSIPVHPEVRPFLQAAAKFAESGNEANVYESVTRNTDCSTKLQMTIINCPEFKQARIRAMTRLNTIEPARVLKDMKLVEDTCCIIKAAQGCLPTESKVRCDAERRDFSTAVFDRINRELGCASKTFECRA